MILHVWFQFESMLSACQERNIKRKCKNTSGPFDQRAVDSSKVFMENRNKWDADFTETLRVPGFWVLKDVACLARDGWRHHLRFLQQAIGENESHLQLLVCGGAERLLRVNFEARLSARGQQWAAIEQLMVEVGFEDAPAVRCAVVSLALCG